MKMFFNVTEEGQEILLPEFSAGLQSIAKDFNHRMAELLESSQQEFEKYNYLSFIKKTPQLARYEKDILSGFEYVAKANGSDLESSIDNANRFIGASFEEKKTNFFNHVLIKVGLAGMRQAILSAQKHYQAPEIKEMRNMVLSGLVRVSHFISLLTDDPLAQQIMITPTQYRLVFDYLESVTIFASTIENISETQKKLAFTIYDIACNLILPFFEHRFFIVEAASATGSNESGNRQKANNICFRVKPVDLKGEAAAMRIRLANWYIADNQRQIALEIAEQIELPYCARNTQPSRDLLAQLVKNQDSFKHEYKNDPKKWLAIQTKHAQTYSIDNKLKNVWYYLWVKLELSSENVNLALALSYIEALHRTWRLIPKRDGYRIVVPDIAEHYLVLANKYSNRNQAHRVAYCLELASELHEEMEQQFQSASTVGGMIIKNSNYKKFKQQQKETKARLTKMRDDAFSHLTTEWQRQSPSFEYCMAVQFDSKTQTVTIKCQNNASTKAYARQCRFAQVNSQLNNENIIIISDAYKITAKSLKSICHRAESEMAYKKRKITERLQAQQRLQQLVEEQAQQENDATVVHDELAQVIKRQPAVSKKSPAPLSAKPKEDRTLAPKIYIDWTDITEDDVYPIPSPDICNVGMIKGVYFGYIPADLEDQFDDQALFQRFVVQLALGSITRKGDAQGIRSICGEVNDDESDYIFKINIGREDLRLYGRKVATRDVNGDTKILVCFDQLLSHKKQLKPIAESIRPPLH